MKDDFAKTIIGAYPQLATVVALTVAIIGILSACAVTYKSFWEGERARREALKLVEKCEPHEHERPGRWRYPYTKGETIWVVVMLANFSWQLVRFAVSDAADGWGILSLILSGLGFIFAFFVATFSAVLRQLDRVVDVVFHVLRTLVDASSETLRR